MGRRVTELFTGRLSPKCEVVDFAILCAEKLFTGKTLSQLALASYFFITIGPKSATAPEYSLATCENTVIFCLMQQLFSTPCQQLSVHSSLFSNSKYALADYPFITPLSQEWERLELILIDINLRVCVY
jgi:hypothetical protein